MDPNTSTNTGTDIGQWISIAVAWVFCILTILLVFKFIVKWRVAIERWDKRKGGVNPEEVFKGVILSSLLGVGMLATALWLTFGAYGPGQPVNLPTAEQDGFNELIEEHPAEISDEEKEQLGREKLPEILKEVQRKAAQDAGTEDDYIKKAIERAKKMQGE